MFEKIVIVTRKTRLAELIERFNTRGQAKFYIEHSGGNFAEFVNEDDVYRSALERVRKQVDIGLKLQEVERRFVPTCIFSEKDLVITLGQDGLVANTAKYVKGQPIVAINPDPAQFDGILLPISVQGCGATVDRVLHGTSDVKPVTLARVVLNDGQSLLAFNDLFIGPSSHISARYQLTFNEKTEAQSSSGIIVSTGAGSTGWLSSVFQMVNGVCASFGSGEETRPMILPWDDTRLLFVVREPFRSRHSEAGIVAGIIQGGTSLVIESRMPTGGVIFSDGVEQDYLRFNAGASATISAADHKANLVVH